MEIEVVYDELLSRIADIEVAGFGHASVPPGT
jgi:hypothetical protein